MLNLLQSQSSFDYNKMKFTKLILLPFSIIYAIVIFVRNKAFDLNILKSHSYDIPIITIGNICIGGSGKTPHIDYLINLLKDNYKIAVLSRGYGRISKGFRWVELSSNVQFVGDEPLQLKLKHSEVLFAVCESRKEGIERLKSKNIDLILLDDAFQHRWVKAGLSILLTPYKKLYIDDYLLPVGNLREFRSASSRADLIVVSKTPDPLLPMDEHRLKEQIIIDSDQNMCFSFIKYLPVYSLFENIPLDIKDHKILLVTAIADPSPIVEYIEENGGDLAKHLKFIDHYSFKNKDVDKILDSLRKIRYKERLILTTEKDAVRLKNFEDRLKGINIGVLPAEVKFHGKKNFNNLIFNYLEKSKANS